MVEDIEKNDLRDLKEKVPGKLFILRYFKLIKQMTLFQAFTKPSTKGLWIDWSQITLKRLQKVVKGGKNF